MMNEKLLESCARISTLFPTSLVMLEELVKIKSVIGREGISGTKSWEDSCH